MSAELLGFAMADRRHELGETVAAIADRAGIARSSWTKLELVQRSSLRAPTGTKIDEVLGWVHGTAARAFATPEEEDADFGFVFRSGEGPHYDLVAELEDGRRISLEAKTSPPNDVRILTRLLEELPPDDFELAKTWIERLFRASEDAFVVRRVRVTLAEIAAEHGIGEDAG